MKLDSRRHLFRKLAGKRGRIDLSEVSPEPPDGLDSNDIKARFDELASEIGRLQELLYSAGMARVVAVFQGMDTSGKDGTIRKVFANTDPLGCHAWSFKAPSEAELAQDFLWRIHARMPPLGHIGLFNRSHYEDVLIARVQELVPEERWRKRYRSIVDFERMLVDNDTILLKFFLHIDLGEQEKRLLAREREVEKSWKLTAQDWKERKRWDSYMEAYADALAECNAPHAPWYVVPANKKWYRNFVVADAIREALAAREEGWRAHLAELSRKRLAEIKRYRSS
jgi:PPK2 family polyphosphate:nucleotide phosphotransferase